MLRHGLPSALIAALVVPAAASAAPSPPVVATPVVAVTSPCFENGRQLRVSWQPGAGGDPVVRYQVLVARPQGSVPIVAANVASIVRQWTLVGMPAYNEKVEVIVRAFDATGATADSAPVLASGPADLRRPDAPSGFTVTEERARVVLRWAKPADDVGLCGYDIQRDGLPYSTAAVQAEHWYDENVQPGETHTYTITARDPIGPGAPAQATITLAPPRVVPVVGSQPTCAYRDTPVSAGLREEILLASICLVNYERGKAGLPPVFVDARLNAAAQGHSEDMVARSFFDHRNPDGCNPGCRARAAGYPEGAGENIYTGPRTAKAAVAGWMDSPGHRSNILTGSYWTMGAGGQFKNAAMWTHTFGFVPPSPGAVTGLEPQFQGAADPTGKVARTVPRRPAVHALSARLRGRRVTVKGRATRVRSSVRIKLRRGHNRRQRQVRANARGAFVLRINAPRGRGRIVVTATLGKSKRSVVAARRRS